MTETSCGCGRLRLHVAGNSVTVEGRQVSALQTTRRGVFARCGFCDQTVRVDVLEPASVRVTSHRSYPGVEHVPQPAPEATYADLLRRLRESNEVRAASRARVEEARRGLRQTGRRSEKPKGWKPKDAREGSFFSRLGRIVKEILES